MIGPGEILFITVAGLILLRPEDLPRVMRRLAKGYRAWQQFSDSLRQTILSEAEEGREKKEQTAPPTPCLLKEYQHRAGNWTEVPPQTSKPHTAGDATATPITPADPRCHRLGPPAAPDTDSPITPGRAAPDPFPQHQTRTAASQGNSA